MVTAFARSNRFPLKSVKKNSLPARILASPKLTIGKKFDSVNELNLLAKPGGESACFYTLDMSSYNFSEHFLESADMQRL